MRTGDAGVKIPYVVVELKVMKVMVIQKYVRKVREKLHVPGEDGR